MTSDIEVLTAFYIAGRDMNHSVTKYLELIHNPETAKTWLEQMKIDLDKWKAVDID